MAEPAVAVEATTIDWASIILPMTPPDEFAAAIRIGRQARAASAVILCKLPNSTFEAVSEPGQRDAEPAEQRAEERVEHARAAKARPSVASRPE